MPHPSPPRAGSAVDPPARGAGPSRIAERVTLIRVFALVGAVIVLALAFLLALMIGARTLDPGTALSVILGSRTDTEAVFVITQQRLPRSTIAVVAGLALGVAGGLIQALTRNPLADPGILGLSSGSSFFIAISVVVTGISSRTLQLPFAFVGALVVAVAMFAIGGGSHDRSSIARITLAGMALGAVISGIVSALTLIDPKAYSVLQAWNAASLETRSWSDLLPGLPFVVIGAILAISLGPSLNALALGDDLARSLGTRVGAVRMLALVAVTLLVGAATAMAGPIAFVGLMMPHLARALVGVDQRWVLGLTAVLSPVLVLAADVLGRVVLPNGEMPVGIVTAFLGAPVLVWLARRPGLVRST